MLFSKRDPHIRSRTTSVDSGIERVVEDICFRFGVTGKGSSAATRKAESEAKANKSTFFGLRARNNTINSTSSSVQSLPSTVGTGQSSCRSSFDEKPYNLDFPFIPNDQKSKARYGVTRGVKLTRESSKVSLTSTLGRVEEVNDEQAAYGTSHSANEPNIRPSGGKIKNGTLFCTVANTPNLETEWKRLISSPFGFQHVAHVKREQSSALENPSHEKLAASVSTAQTSQHTRQGSIDVQTEAASQDNSEPITFKEHEIKPQDRGDSFTAHGSAFSVKQECSTGTSVPQSQTAAIRQPIKFSNGMTPPPRSSSRNAVTFINLSNSIADDGVIADINQIDASGPLGKEDDMAKIYSDRSNNRQLIPGRIVTSVPRIMDLPHAVTTPDESAVPAISPSYSLDLEDVPEEEEGYFFQKLLNGIQHGPLSESSISPQKSTRTLQSWGSRSTVSDNFSSPCSPVNNQISSKWKRIGPTLMSSSGPDNRKRLSHRFNDLECSWEDDIDFCYEHAAEADCDFDWQSPYSQEDYIKADLDAGTPFTNALYTSQLTGTGQLSVAKPKKRTSCAHIQTSSNEQLQPPSELLVDTQVSPQSHCRSSLPDDDNIVFSSPDSFKKMEDENSLGLNRNINNKLQKPSTPSSLSSEEYGIRLADVTFPLPGSLHAKRNFPALYTHENTKFESSMLALNKAPERLSRSSSFESILKPYSELPNSLQSSSNSFEFVIDLATSSYEKVA